MAILWIIDPGFFVILGVLKNVHTINMHPVIESEFMITTNILTTTDSEVNIYIIYI